MAYDGLVAKFTLASSFVSCLASSVMLVLCLVLPRRWQPSFPNAIILNLALAGTCTQSVILLFDFSHQKVKRSGL